MPAIDEASYGPKSDSFESRTQIAYPRLDPFEGSGNYVFRTRRGDTAMQKTYSPFGHRFGTRVVTLALVFVAFAVSHAAAGLTPQEAKQIAIDSYIYGYSLMTSDVTEKAFINTTAPSPETFQAPLNQLVNIPKYPPADYKGVTAPNADTLYTAGFMDVTKEPVLLSYPDMHGRYFLFPIYSQWTNVLASPGKRTLGTGPQTIAIIGPNWHGTLPAGVTQVVKSPTNTVFTIGRVYADGTAADYAEVNATQKEFKLVPLSSYGKPYTVPAGKLDPQAPSVKDKVRDIIGAMNIQTYFNAMAKSMAINPPVMPQDASIVAEMAKIGLVPGKPFTLSSLPAANQAVLTDVAKIASEQMAEQQKTGNKVVNGWLLTTGTGEYGTKYLWRAAVANFGWGANLDKDAIYPSTKLDNTGATLTGTNTYVVHFAKGETPPVDGFWSITMYDSSYYFHPNSLNKLTVSMRDKPVANADGSLDLYFSHLKPANSPEANWLPAPANPFILMMRMYWPRETPPSLLDGTWTIPAVKQAS
jgi:hypothetical protein